MPRRLKTLDDQRQFLSFFDGLCSAAQELAAHVQSLERQGAAHSPEVALMRDDMTWLEESAMIGRLPLTKLLYSK